MFELDNKFSHSILDILVSETNFIKKKKIQYLNVPCVFDIECSSFYLNETKSGCMYAWVFGMNGKCIRGRTWKEFVETMNYLIEEYNLKYEIRHMIIYVHNLAYEFQWMKSYFNWAKVFSTDSRKPLYAITNNGLEFRCSYMLSGYNLAKLGENLHKYKVAKLVGDLDYNKIRHSQTPLTDTEWHYILNDGLVVMAHIQEEIERLGKITKLPLTNTGYVRDLCRNACFTGEERFTYYKKIRYMKLSPQDYLDLKEVFMGGFTHANHNHVGVTLKNVGSYDLTSAYPSVMIAEKFPCSPPMKLKIKDYDDLKEKMQLYCCLFKVRFKNIVAKVDYEHYISRSKCTYIKHYILDNGRVVESSDLEMLVTEQDFYIIEKCYEWDELYIDDFKAFYKFYLPKSLITTILDLYENKTTLKDVDDKIVEYMKSKGMLNSTYGMCVTDIAKELHTYDNIHGWDIEKSNLEDLIEEYNTNKRRFLYYAWGIWITAYNRRNLWNAILELKDDYVYSDTDSVKALNLENHKKFFEDYNKDVIAKLEKCLKRYNIDVKRIRPKTIKGVEKPLGVWDFEGTYDNFKTLGAKRYLYNIGNKLNVTISGVNKKVGSDYLKFKFKTIENVFKGFEENLEFPSTYLNDDGVECSGCGKLTHTYIDGTVSGEITDYLGFRSKFYELGIVHLEPTSYVLSLDSNFLNYLLGDRSVFIETK